MSKKKLNPKNHLKSNWKLKYQKMMKLRKINLLSFMKKGKMNMKRMKPLLFRTNWWFMPILHIKPVPDLDIGVMLKVMLSTWNNLKNTYLNIWPRHHYHRPCRHLLHQAKGAEGPGRCNQVRRKTHHRRTFRSPFRRFNHKRVSTMHKAADWHLQQIQILSDFTWGGSSRKSGAIQNHQRKRSRKRHL